jgi:hypothetical protein
MNGRSAKLFGNVDGAGPFGSARRARLALEAASYGAAGACVRVMRTFFSLQRL